MMNDIIMYLSSTHIAVKCSKKGCLVERNSLWTKYVRFTYSIYERIMTTDRFFYNIVAKGKKGSKRAIYFFSAIVSFTTLFDYYSII